MTLKIVVNSNLRINLSKRNNFVETFLIFPLTKLFIILLLAVTTALSQSEPPLNNTNSNANIVILMRHALAPGFGDPPHFRIGVRSSQRNLSEEGRDQAKMAGERMREIGFKEVELYSSQWYRCLDTAELLGYKTVEELPFLNSFFDRPGRKTTQTDEALQWLENYEFTKPLFWVTHQVNIISLTGIVPSSGEILIMEWLGKELKLLHRIVP